MAQFHSKASKRNSSKLIFLGLFIFAFGAVNYHRVRVLSFSKTPEEINVQGEIPQKITIPSIEIDIPVSGGEIVNGVWQISYNNVTFLNSSAPLKTGGNTVVYGHNKKAILGNLPYLSIGQKISITSNTGRIYEYLVYKKDFVNADRVDLVSPTDHEELTIFTCWGLFDTQRVVIKAKPL